VLLVPVVIETEPVVPVPNPSAELIFTDPELSVELLPEVSTSEPPEDELPKPPVNFMLPPCPFDTLPDNTIELPKSLEPSLMEPDAICPDPA
jgi:hypothetical protein